MYNRIHTISACDGRTDRRIDILPRHSPRYAYASRGKTKMRWAARITPNGVKPRLCVCYVSFRIILNDVDNNCFFGDKILYLQSNFRKFGTISMFRSLIRILRASLVQIHMEMAEKYAKQQQPAASARYAVTSHWEI